MARTRAAFEKGDYRGALTSAQGLAPKIQSAVEAASKKKDELMAAFDALKGSLPAKVQSLTGRLGQLAAAKSLPRDLDMATVEAAQANLGTFTLFQELLDPAGGLPLGPAGRAHGTMS